MTTEQIKEVDTSIEKIKKLIESISNMPTKAFTHKRAAIYRKACVGKEEECRRKILC